MKVLVTGATHYERIAFVEDMSVYLGPHRTIALVSVDDAGAEYYWKASDAGKQRWIAASIEGQQNLVSGMVGSIAVMVDDIDDLPIMDGAPADLKKIWWRKPEYDYWFSISENPAYNTSRALNVRGNPKIAADIIGLGGAI